MQGQSPTPKKHSVKHQQSQPINPQYSNSQYSNPQHASKPSWQEVQQQLEKEGWQPATPCHPAPTPNPCQPHPCPPHNKPCNCKGEDCNCREKKREQAGSGFWFASWGLLGLASLLFLLSLLNAFRRPVISITLPPTQVTTNEVHHDYKEVTPIPAPPDPVPDGRLW